MDPYLLQLSSRLADLKDPREINEALDKLEFLFEALDDYQQELASRMMEQLHQRLVDGR